MAEFIVPQRKVRSIAFNWTIGMTNISLLMMYKRTRDKKYLAAVSQGGEYLKALQVLDTRDKRHYGMIREFTPQTPWCHPRDTLSAAWSMLHMGQVFKNSDYLDRTLAFAHWFKKNAIKSNYPAWTCFLGKKEPEWLMGSFHGGSPLFFMDLFKYTGDRQWMDKVALPVLNAYLKTFMKPDGSIRIIVDHRNKRDLTDVAKYGPLAWQHMHKYNDDFTCLALMRAYKVTGKEKYLEPVVRYMDWVRQNMNADGSFGRPPVYSASASLIIELTDLFRITGKKEYYDTCVKAAGYLLGLQELKCRDKRAYGGFYGLAGNVHRNRYLLSIRSSAYAIPALLKLEGRLRYSYYSA